MRVAGVACVLVLSAPCVGARADPLRRLEAVQLGWGHELTDEEAGDAAMLSIEAGRFYSPRLGMAGLLRYAGYDDRKQILVGPRIYVEAVPDRLLLALGAGVLINHLGHADNGGNGPQGQPFVEAYAGVLFMPSGHYELEVGILGGVAPDEELGWLGLAFGLRRRTW